jgi:formate dehydrogenase subunit gamma
MSQESRLQGVRHRLADRLFHWATAIVVVVLLATAFLPILGIRFNWVPLHWTFGVALVLLVLFHLYRVTFVHGVGEMIPGKDDIRETGRAITGTNTDDLAEAKYDAFQKGFHLAAAITIIAVSVTGILMLFRIDTTFWRRDPSIMTDYNWGIVYVVHGAASLVLLFLIILHIYFALLPEHRDLLKAMLIGRGPTKARKGKS